MELLNNDTTDILNRIFEIQISAYNRIIQEDISEEDQMFLLQFQSSDIDIKNMAELRLEQYEKLKNNPAMIHLLDDQELATLRHILYRMEDIWVCKNYAGVMGCWELFFSIEEFRIPRIKYTNKIIKFTRNGNKN